MNVKRVCKSVFKYLSILAIGYVAVEGVLAYALDSSDPGGGDAYTSVTSTANALEEPISDSDDADTRKLKQMYQQQVAFAKSAGVDLNPQPEDYIKKYKMASANHDWLHACRAAKTLLGIYYDNSDEDNYNVWAVKEKKACQNYMDA